MIEDESIRIATACAAIIQKNDIMDPHVTKVVRDFDGNALYFSHAPIPWVRESSEHVAVRALEASGALRLSTRCAA